MYSAILTQTTEGFLAWTQRTAHIVKGGRYLCLGEEEQKPDEIMLTAITQAGELN